MPDVVSHPDAAVFTVAMVIVAPQAGRRGELLQQRIGRLAEKRVLEDLSRLNLGDSIRDGARNGGASGVTHIQVPVRLEILVEIADQPLEGRVARRSEANLLAVLPGPIIFRGSGESSDRRRPGRDRWEPPGHRRRAPRSRPRAGARHGSSKKSSSSHRRSRNGTGR